MVVGLPDDRHRCFMPHCRILGHHFICRLEYRSMTDLKAAKIIIRELKDGLPPRKSPEIAAAFERAVDVGFALTYEEALRWAQLIVLTATMDRKGR